VNKVASTDAEQWARAVGGDGESFAVLFDRHQQRVHRHACRLVDSVQDAEDVTAAAFLELWRRRTIVRLVDGSVLPWLLVTTSNLARNVQRGVRRHRAFIARLPRSNGHMTTYEPARDASSSESWSDVDDHLDAALRQLRAADLRLVTLVVIEGFSLAEAGDLLGLTPSAAKTRMYRARQRLREALPGRVEPPNSRTRAGAQ